MLNNLGGFAYHRGRWDEAVALYRRAAEGSQRAGDVANAAFGDCNVGEVLSDQGRWAEAEQALREAVRIWRGSSYEWGSAFATALLGRNTVRAGRHAEGLELLEASLSDLRRLGARSDAALVEAYIAEAHAFRHEPERALAAADRLLRDARRTAPLLHRVRAFALAQRGALEPAEHALEASLAEALAQGSDFEVAVTLDAIERLRDGRAATSARRGGGEGTRCSRSSTSRPSLRLRWNRPRRPSPAPGRGPAEARSAAHRGIAEPGRHQRADHAVAGADLLARGHARRSVGAAVREQPGIDRLGRPVAVPVEAPLRDRHARPPW